MKSLITGCSGFIGGHLEKKAEFEVTKRFSDKDVEVIYSVASAADVSASLENPRHFIRNNTDLIIDLLEHARTLPKLKHFIHLSTSEVYGPCTGSEDKKEWSSIATHSPYAASKAAQEAICMAYWKSFGVPVTIVNTMNVFGEGQQMNKFIPMVVKKILYGQEITVHAQAGKGSLRRRYIHADNVAHAMFFLAGRPYDPSDILCPRFNVVGEEEISLLKLVYQISKIVGKEAETRIKEPSRPGHVGRYSLDGSKLSLLGWKAPMNFKESLDKTVNHLRCVLSEGS